MSSEGVYLPPTAAGASSYGYGGYSPYGGSQNPSPRNDSFRSGTSDHDRRNRTSSQHSGDYRSSVSQHLPPTAHLGPVPEHGGYSGGGLPPTSPNLVVPNSYVHGGYDRTPSARSAHSEDSYERPGSITSRQSLRGHSQDHDAHGYGDSSNYPSHPMPSIDTGDLRGGTLTVRIIAAFNLKNLDSGWFGDFSDPYVFMKLGNKEHRTQTINNNLNPVWNTNPFVFPVDPENSEMRYLTMEVRNSNNVSKDDLLGVVEIDARRLTPGQVIYHKEKLMRGEGQLEYEVVLQDTPSFPRSTSRQVGATTGFGSRDFGASSRDGSYSQHGGDHKGSREDLRRPPNLGVNITGGRVKVRIIAAYSLRNTDIQVMHTDVSDPFVRVKVGQMEAKTRTIENNLNPVWNAELMDFEIHRESDTLQIEVFNEKMWSAHDSLGTLEYDIRSILPPGEVHFLGRQPLKGGDSGCLDLEVCYFPPHLVAQGIVEPYPQESFHRRASRPDRQHHHVDNWVPLPQFDAKSAEALSTPTVSADEEGKLGKFRKKLEYESLACHLGQYDYAKDAHGDPQPIYYPKQDIPDKREWHDDPFYGWRSPADDRGGYEKRNRGHRLGLRSPLVERNQSEQRQAEAWHRDPFHGWLRNERDAAEGGGNERVQAAQAARQLNRLPSFSDDPRSRVEGAEYMISDEHEKRRTRYTPDSTQSLEKNWSHDAFFGWLPGRGPSSEKKHELHRPFEEARIQRLPSFSENALMGLSGKGSGVVKVWVIAAKNLRFSHSSMLRGRPSACVKVRVGRQEQRTATIPLNADPTWNEGPMMFEVMSVTDELIFTVADLGVKVSSMHNQILGEHKVNIQRLYRDYEGRRSRHVGGNENDEVERVVTGFELLQDESGRTRDCGEIKVAYQVQRYEDKKPVRDDLREPRREIRPIGTNSLSDTMHAGSFMSDTSSIHGGHSIGTLQVWVKAAHNLVKLSSSWFGGASDAYVNLYLESQKGTRRPKRTKTIQNNVNPRWYEQPFLLKVYSEDDNLVLEVKHEDMQKGDDPLGDMTIPLASVIRQPMKQPVWIRDQLNNVAHGELEVEIGFAPG